MKRRLAMLLAALMLVSCLCPALAAEDGTAEVPPDEAAEETLYDQYGPWGTWTEEQKAAAESWTEEDWELYWNAYSDGVYLDNEQYWDDVAEWSMAYYGYEEYDYEEARRQEKADMGMPYPGGPNVSLEGAYLDFGGTAPILAQDGYTILVPFRAFLEGVGAEVGYAGGKATAKLPGGGSVEVAAGDEFLACTVGDKINMVGMSAPPEAKSGILYVDGEALAAVLGLAAYRVYWYDTLILTDLEALKAEINGEFTHFNALLAASAATADPTQNYQSTVTATAAGTLYGDKEHRTATATLRSDILSGPKGISTDSTVKVDLGGIAQLLKDMTAGYGWDSGELTTYLKEVNGSRVRSITNYETGDYFVKGSFPSPSSYGFVPPQDVWLRSGGSVADGGEAGPLTMGDLILNQAGFPGGGWDSDPYGAVMTTAGVCALFLGDGVFTVENTGTTNTYRADVDQAAFLKAVKLLEPDYYTDEELEARYGGTAFRLTVKATERGGKLLDADVGFTCRVGGLFPMTITAQFSGTGLSGKGSVALVGDYLGKVELSLAAESRATPEAAPAAPPAGEQVRDFSEVYEEYLADWESQWYGE